MFLISNKFTNYSNNQIILDDDFIKHNDMCTCLSVKIDGKLNFSNHVTYVSSKLLKNTGVFYRIKDSMTKQTRMIFIMPSYILPCHVILLSGRDI